MTDAQPTDVTTQASAVQSTVATFRAALERGDVQAAAQTLAPDVVFHSPIVFHDYIGHAAVTALLTVVAQVFADFRYTTEFTALNGHALVFRATVNGRDLEGIDILAFDADGLIHDFTVMVRPYSAATALREAMAARMGAASAVPPVS